MDLEKYIRQRLEQKPIGLMTHVIAGYPSFDDNLRALEIMAENNVDVVEIQMPFSEPTADGPIFVRANQESLKRGTTVKQYFEFMKNVSTKFDFPILMMGYYNTVFKMGETTFLDKLELSNGRGFIIPDLPIEEADSFYKQAKQRSLAPITMATPTTKDKRLQKIGQVGAGFVYVVARAGVTGKKTEFAEFFEDYIKRCRKAIQLPLAVGFGVSRQDDLQYLTGQADIAIIGTALLKAWEENGKQGLRKFFNQLLNK